MGVTDKRIFVKKVLKKCIIAQQENIGCAEMTKIYMSLGWGALGEQWSDVVSQTDWIMSQQSMINAWTRLVLLINRETQGRTIKTWLHSSHMGQIRMHAYVNTNTTTQVNLFIFQPFHSNTQGNAFSSSHEGKMLIKFCIHWQWTETRTDVVTIIIETKC